MLRALMGTMILMFLAMTPSLSPAQSTGKVTEFGVYNDDHVLTKRTREIAAGKPVRFGFCFSAKVDAEDGGTTLVETLKHPPLMQRNGIETTGYSMPRMFQLKDGVVNGCTGYFARDPAELRPGIWKFTLSDGGDDVVVQEFVVR